MSTTARYQELNNNNPSSSKWSIDDLEGATPSPTKTRMKNTNKKSKGNGKGNTKPRALRIVKSGIGLSGMDGSTHPSIPGKETPPEPASFITSRTARVLLAGAGFLADAYDLFVINLVLRLLRAEYPQYANTGQLHALEGSVASSALFGSIIGQLVAGSLADVIGRKKIFVATALLITVGSLGSAASFELDGVAIYTVVACWRFVLGIGVGGEYPLAATVTSESTSAARRGSLMAAVFSMQGVGALISVMVVLVCLELGFSNAFTWRFALAFGSVPALLAFPWRLRMHETETFERVKQERKDARATINASSGTMSASTSMVSLNSSGSLHGDGDDGSGYGSSGKSHNKNNTNNFLSPSHPDGLHNQQEHQPPNLIVAKSRWEEVKHAIRYYKWHMLGTSLCWFLLDVDFYANGIFNHDVTSVILSHGRQTSVTEDAWNSALVCALGVPGYWLSVSFMESVGRKNVQMNGFLMMALLFFICGIGHDWFLDPVAAETSSHRKYLFLILYALTFLFSNFGPNTTCFVIPGEIYPAEVRATCHGFSAACGKLGAATGAFFFPMVLGPGGASAPTPQGLKTCMFICSVVAVLGAITTHLFIPRYGAKDLEVEDSYLMLELPCLVPTDESLLLIQRAREARAMPYTMVQVVDSSADYSLGFNDQLDEDIHDNNNDADLRLNGIEMEARNTNRNSYRNQHR